MEKLTAVRDIFRIVNGEETDPHRVLGMHEITADGETQITVRVFLPGGQKVVVIDQENRRRKYPMEKVHQDGFFQVLLSDRAEWFPYQLEYTDATGHTWRGKDPYEFQPTISEYDRYLFGAGNHYDIYDKMGGRLITHGGTKGAGFTVWAPNALGVSVVGDFNQWDSRRHRMRMLGSSGVWEIFIPALKAGDLYKFHVVQCNGREVDKSDPYARAAQLRPDTASVLYAPKHYKWKDRRWQTTQSRSNHFKSPMNIYEVHLGSWMRVPEEEERYLTYEELAERLVPYVKDMGYSHIELMPVSEYPFDGSWGYQVTGYYAPTSRYGTPDGFKHFVDVCHANQIGVILDWVPAHFPKDDFALGRFDGTPLYEHSNPFKGEQPQWGTYVFNYGRQEVSNFLIGNALFWLKEYHIDGLRVDAVASMLYLDFQRKDGEWHPNQYGGNENLEAVAFLKHLNATVKKLCPQAIMIAEESSAWQGITKDTEEGGLGFTLKWNMGWMNDFLYYIEQDPLYRKFHHSKITFGMAYHYSENFVLVLSHDEVVHEKSSMVGKMPGDDWQRFANLRVAYGFMYAHPGKKLLFMGGEFGQYNEWSEARSLDWHLLAFDDHKETLAYTKALNQLYTREAALWEWDFDPNGFQWIECDDKESSVVSMIRRSHDKELYMICNFTPNVYEGYRLGVPYAGTYREIFNSDKTEFGGTGMENTQPLVTENIPWNHFQESICLRVPPLGMVVLEQTKVDGI